MPKGNTTTTGFVADSAQESIRSILLEVLPLLRSRDPRAWETLGLRLDKAADYARAAEKDLDLQAAAKAPTAPSGLPAEIQAFLQDYMKDVRPGAHQIIFVASPEALAQHVRGAMAQDARRRA
jgi:hypothetical protein